MPPVQRSCCRSVRPGLCLWIGATFTPNKKWAVSPLISPPAVRTRGNHGGQIRLHSHHTAIFREFQPDTVDCRRCLGVHAARSFASPALDQKGPETSEGLGARPETTLIFVRATQKSFGRGRNGLSPPALPNADSNGRPGGSWPLHTRDESPRDSRRHGRAGEICG